MNQERMFEFRIGLMVLASIIVVIILALLFGPQESVLNLDGRYQLQVQFESAPDVNVNTPVLKSGIRIGRVENIELVNEDRQALITVAIDANRVIYSDEVCWINRSLIGDSSLEFVKRPEPLGYTAYRIEPGSEPLQGHVMVDPVQAVGKIESSLNEAIGNVSLASRHMSEFINRVNIMIGSPEEVQAKTERFNAIIDKTYETMGSIENLSQSVNEIVGDPQLRDGLRKVLNQLPEMVSETRAIVQRMNRSMDLVDTNLENVKGFTEALSDQGGNITSELRESAESLNQLLANLKNFSAALNEKGTTLNSLIHDRELYDRIRRTTANIEELTVEARPIVQDIRVLSDKMARNPGIILRDAIKPGPGLKNLSSLNQSTPGITLPYASQYAAPYAESYSQLQEPIYYDSPNLNGPSYQQPPCNQPTYQMPEYQSPLLP